MKNGFTLTQVTVAIALVSLMAGVTMPRFSRFRDRLSVHSATMDVVSALSRARAIAFERSVRAAVTFDVPSATLAIHSYGDTLDVRPLGALYGVSIRASRDSVTYARNAMGFGASNTRVIVARGAIAETVTVSRLGRVKR
ncbi:MAG: hypothetical protein MNPFHGCM_02379 [Gemmatimonadaceae bacterium]|nr:hypothetical protein [Gemmatimonadaceae bacterium]